MARIDATPATAAALAKVPGLRERVEESLSAILETAREIRRLSDGHTELEFDAGHFLRVRVGSYMISYTLDVALTVATVVFVEEMKSRPPDVELVSKAS
ncbi:MAG TPA: hypothetical protein VGH20_10865 [Myxococcales bacterium]|jgi:mRNA-degrading endonuclease RelE of RelBE toxin-antitoxin system